MLVIVGSLIVFVCVFGGYMAEGGHLHALLHPMPIELMIIFGSGAGGLVISASIPQIKAMMGQVMGTLKSHEATQKDYLDLLLLIYELCKMARANPLSLEPHVEKPKESEIFKRYPSVLHNEHAVHFLCDTLKVQISAPMSPFDLEALMDTDLNIAHKELHHGPAAIARLGDAMPGLGIVAAVLGVVITMGKLSAGKEAIGQSVAAALVGTFLGILLSYGFMQPLAAKMEANNEEHSRMFDVIKSGVLAYSKDCSPKVCVEFARRTIPTSVRPTFEDVDKATSNAGKAA